MELQKDNPAVTAFNQMAQEAEELQAKRFSPRKEKAAEMKTEVKDEKPKFDLKPCPFCGKTNLKVLTTGGYDVGYNCRVVCRTEGCYASGIPLGGDPETEEEAVRIWNMRKGDSCCDAGKERQMPETKNELAELAEEAEELKCVLEDLKFDRRVVVCDKLQRIVAELAKVETPYDLVGLVGKCHAIAGECQEVDAEIPDEDRDENFQENC